MVELNGLAFYIGASDSQMNQGTGQISHKLITTAGVF